MDGQQLPLEIKEEEREKIISRPIILICPICKLHLFYPHGNWYSITCPGCGTKIGRYGEL